MSSRDPSLPAFPALAFYELGTELSSTYLCDKLRVSMASLYTDKALLCRDWTSQCLNIFGLGWPYSASVYKVLGLKACVTMFGEILLKLRKNILCVWLFCLRECLCTTCVQCPQRPEEGTRLPGTEVTGGCQPSFACWELIPRPQQEQLVLLTTENYLQSQNFIFN